MSHYAAFESNGGINAGHFAGRACYLVDADGAKHVVEIRVWAPGSYNSEAFYTRYKDAYGLLSVFGIGGVLLMSMRFVHACLAPVLPFAVLWGVFLATSTAPLGESLVAFAPAIGIILAMTRKLEQRDRALFLERRKVKRAFYAKDADIHEKSHAMHRQDTQLDLMKQKLHAAHKMVTNAMAEAHAVLHDYEIDHDELDFGQQVTTLGEGSFGTVLRAVLHGTTDVAVKTMRVSKINAREIQKFKSELLASRR